MDRRVELLRNSTPPRSTSQQMGSLQFQSLIHRYHQNRMNHSSLLTGNILPLIPPIAVTVGTPTYSVTNLYNLTMLQTENQRQLQLLELHDAFNHLSGVQRPNDGIQNQAMLPQSLPITATSDIRPIHSTISAKKTCITNSCNVNDEHICSPRRPASPKFLASTEQKASIEIQKAIDTFDSGHVKPKAKDKVKKSRKGSNSTTSGEKHQKVDTKWNSSYEKLKEFKQLTGHTVVPRGYTLNSKLASWVAEQRKQYRLLAENRRSSITPQRIRLLEDINFVWNAQEESWHRQIQQLRKHHADYGHCNVQVSNPEYPKLGLWVKEQRRHYMLMKQGKPSHMTLERYQLLAALDFSYDTHESTWQQRLAELVEFKKANGSCVVPCNSSNHKLAVWVHHQRRQYKKLLLQEPSHLTPERIAALDNIGFIWFPRKKPGDEQVSNDDYSDDDDDVSIESESDDSDSDDGVDLPPLKRRRKR